MIDCTELWPIHIPPTTHACIGYNHNRNVKDVLRMRVVFKMLEKAEPRGQHSVLRRHVNAKSSAQDECKPDKPHPQLHQMFSRASPPHLTLFVGGGFFGSTFSVFFNAVTYWSLYTYRCKPKSPLHTKLVAKPSIPPAFQDLCLVVLGIPTAHLSFKMSFANLCGDSVLADARLVALDGFVIPFHRIIFRIAPQDRQLAGCAFELYINSHYQDAKTPIPLLFDAQTVWRVLCFIYDGTYQDEDKDLTFPKIEPLDFPPSANASNDEPLEHQEVELIRSLHNLHITSQSCRSEVLVKALNSVKVFRVAFTWNLDRLMVEAAHRFGQFISGAFNQPEFPQIIAPVFNSVIDPHCMLYGHLVQECFSHCQDLVNNEKFITALEHNGKLAVHLYEKLAALQASLGYGNNADVSYVSSVPQPAGTASAVDSSAVTLLQSQLDEALDIATYKQEQIDTLKQEIARLEKTCAEVTASNSTKQERINALELEAARLKESAPQKASIGLEAQIQKLLAQKNTKDAVIDNLEHQLEEKDRKIAELDRNLSNTNGLNTTLSKQINEQRVGKPDNINFLLERNEAVENARKLQARVTEFEDKIKELEGQMAAHAQQSIVFETASAPQPPESNGIQHSHVSKALVAWPTRLTP
ncbi:hypothetical protein KCU62_g286, partial [Aureobasidium sp. EXF-3399]